jgi:hypothetical protein
MDQTYMEITQRLKAADMDFCFQSMNGNFSRATELKSAVSELK